MRVDVCLRVELDGWFLPDVDAHRDTVNRLWRAARIPDRLVGEGDKPAVVADLGVVWHVYGDINLDGLARVERGLTAIDRDPVGLDRWLTPGRRRGDPWRDVDGLVLAVLDGISNCLAFAGFEFEIPIAVIDIQSCVVRRVGGAARGICLDGRCLACRRTIRRRGDHACGSNSTDSHQR